MNEPRQDGLAPAALPGQGQRGFRRLRQDPLGGGDDRARLCRPGAGRPGRMAARVVPSRQSAARVWLVAVPATGWGRACPSWLRLVRAAVPRDE